MSEAVNVNRTNQVSNDEVRQTVRTRYKQIAIQEIGSGSCCEPGYGCCEAPVDYNEVSAKLGYSTEELSTVPVIEVDMTPEMISRARHNAQKVGFVNTEFRLGEIEHLPIENDRIDVIISNCVVNLTR